MAGIVNQSNGHRHIRLRRQERVCNDLRGCPRRSAEGRSVLRLGDAAHAAFLMLDGGADKRGEERMRLEWLGLEFRMELAAEEPGMLRRLDDLHVVFVRRASRDAQSGWGKNFFVFSVELVAVPVALADLELAVGAVSE